MLPAVMPLFRSGFFVSDDGEWMIIRFSAFYESFRDGQFPVRFLQRLNQGYGYPVANFLYPGFMYLGIPVHILGFSYTDTIKILFGTSVIGSVLFMFLWLRRSFSSLPSLAGSIFYGYAPYHLYDLYKRGSLGELLSLTVAPFLFWQVERRSVMWTSLAIAMLILSHNTLSVFFIGLLVCYMLLKMISEKEKRESVIFIFSSLFLGIGAAAFFWIPSIFDLRYTVFSNITVSDWSQYFSSISLVGIGTYIVLTVVLVLLLRKREKARAHSFVILFLFIGICSAFFATSGSAIFWSVLPVQFVQFPFRFLSMTIFAVSFLVAFIFSVLKKWESRTVGLILIIAGLFSSWQMLSHVQVTNQPDSYYATNLDTTTVRQEYMPRWVKDIPISWQQEKVITSDGRVQKIIVTTNSVVFWTNAPHKATYTINKVYFPGWNVTVDGSVVDVSYKNPEGLMRVKVPAGEHKVVAVFKETQIRLISDIISVISFTLILLMSIKKKVR
ncbi:MAG: hypothetical protein RLZZ455_486 [Candidatus Parcubacteria bacterium]|jgi:hypothetical protein